MFNIPPIPVNEILSFLFHLRTNEPFLRISRILLVIMVTLSALGYAGEWIQPYDVTSPACIKGKWDCYQGPALNFADYLLQINASEFLFLLPLIDIIAAIILLVMPSRSYLILFLIHIASITILVVSDPTPYMYFKTGAGQGLHILSKSFLTLLTIPLAINEQMRLYPEFDYKNILRYLPSQLLYNAISVYSITPPNPAVPDRLRRGESAVFCNYWFLIYNH